jgi:hypothetical protein
MLHDAKMLPYVSQTLVDGTPCDLTGQPRQTEVRAICGGGGIRSLAETSTCRYMLLVESANLCNFVGLRSFDDQFVDVLGYSPSGSTVHRIQCLSRLLALRRHIYLQGLPAKACRTCVSPPANGR